MKERVPPLRSQVGKKRSPSPWAFTFIFMFFLGMLLVLFLRSPLSEMELIEIKGNQFVSEREILNKIEFKKGISYFLFSASYAKQALETTPEIKQATVKKMFPNKVYIQVQEKPVIAIWRMEDNRWIPILADGTVLKNRPIQSSELIKQPVFEGWTSYDANFQQTVKELSMVPIAIREVMDTIKPFPGKSDQVQIRTKKQHVIFVRIKDLQKKLLYYPSFLKHPPGKLYMLESIWFSPDGNPGVKNNHP